MYNADGMKVKSCETGQNRAESQRIPVSQLETLHAYTTPMHIPDIYQHPKVSLALYVAHLKLHPLQDASKVLFSKCG